MSTSTDVDTVAVYSKGLFLPSVLLAVVLAGLVAIGLLRLYRRAVLKSMRTRANSRPRTNLCSQKLPLCSSSPCGQGLMS